MQRLARWRRHLVRGLMVLFAILVVATGGLGIFLQTTTAARLVARLLGKVLETNAQIDGISGALVGDSTALGVRMFDGRDSRPLLEVREITTDLSVASILAGQRLPDRIVIRNAHLRLRFDRKGKLLTGMPELPNSGNLPELRILGLTLTLEQEGKPPFVLEGGTLTMAPKLVDNLFGTIDDPIWGRFEVQGRFGKGSLQVSLTSAGLRLTPAQFVSLPFVPPGLTRNLDAEGASVPLSVHLAIGKSQPKVRYRVEFDRVTAKLHEEDPRRPVLVASPARGVLTGDNNSFAFQGDIRDPYWGNWDITAASPAGEDVITLRMKSPEVLVDQKKLEGLPFVPPVVWQQAQAWGRSPVQLDIRSVMNQPGISYRIEMSPREARIRIPLVDLETMETSGQVVIEDNRVWLNSMKGTTAGGSIQCNADLDFRGIGSRLAFELDVRDLTLRQLPAKWDLPRQLDGKVTGKARIHLDIQDDRIKTQGEGSGQIEEATLVGFRTSEPIPLRLHADGKRFQFLPQAGWLQRLFSLKSPPARAGPATSHSVVERAASQPAWAATSLLDGAGALLAAFAWPWRVPPTTHFETGFTLEEVDLSETVRRLELSLPVSLEGQFSLAVRFSLPIDEPGNLARYQLRGSFSAPHLDIAGVRLEQVEARISLDRGVVHLTRLDGTIRSPGDPHRPGHFSARAAVEAFAGDGKSAHLDCKVVMRDFPAGALRRIVPRHAHPLAGKVSGEVRASIPLGRWREPQAWHGSARFVAPRLELAGQLVRDLSASFRVRGLAGARGELSAECARGPIFAEANWQTRGEGSLTGSLSVRGLDAALIPLPAQGATPVEGSVDIRGSIAGLREIATVSLKGTIEARSLRIASGKSRGARANWALDRHRLELSGLNADLYGGNASGWGRLELGTGQGQVELFVQNLEPGKILAVEGRPEDSIEGAISGQASGKFDLHQGTAALLVDVVSPRLTVKGIPAEKLKGRLDVTQRKLTYQLEGEVMGGQIALEGKYPPPPVSPVDHPHGWIRLRNLQLTRLWPLLGQSNTLGGLRGSFTLSLPFRHEGTHPIPAGRGQFEIRDLRWNDGELMDLVRGDLNLSPRGATVRNVGGLLAGGTLRISAGYRLDQPSRSWLDVRLARAELSRLPVFVGQDLVRGPIDLVVHATLGNEWRGSGSASLSRGKVFGIEVSDWRLPMEFNFSPASGIGELHIRESSAQIGQGRAQLRTDLTWAGNLRLEGNLIVVDAALSRLAGFLGDVTSFARGRVSGRISFAAAELRSLGDLTATVHATLHDAQALQLPILRLLVPHVVPGQGAAEFNAGELRGTLSSGVFRISELTLESNLAQLIVQGSVTTQGRLDLEALAHTTTPAFNPVVLRLLFRRLPPVGPLPVSLVVRATEQLADRVVHLRIGGTTRSPQVRVEPIRILSEQAVRFFLSKAAGAVGP